MHGDLRVTPPPEDAGAETAARYHYQYECVARECMLILTDAVVEVVCEWHGDYLVVRPDGTKELVSVKHREPHLPYTFHQMCQEALARLYERWSETGQTAACRLSTNSGLRPGAADTRQLADACANGDGTSLDGFASTMAASLGDPVDAVRRFLASLRIEAELPNKNDIRAVNLDRFARPLLAEIGRDPNDAEPWYDAIVQLISAASRAQRISASQAWKRVLWPSALDSDSVIAETVAARTITRADVLRCLMAQSAAFLVTGETAPPASTALVRKLRAGGLGPNAISNAQNLRAIWYAVESAMRTGLPEADAALLDLRARLRDLADQAESSVIGDSDPYGVRMLAVLRDLLDQRPPPHPFRLEPLHLLGLIYQLTDECSVWWSPEFELGRGTDP